ncbi:hypothetical protein F5B22DRAFT_607705 [Xylaria bambusicola]|uniref:uncharacterized protein n=1 Tax=Xylaria bambusicola TaxID=326684 RepID=UPI002007C643|nr:uncharacterized protein F5B22DRAFT_607705 [Xylaria bambusicola]KAI0515250.1 hypothetical protein F5B22DRAFT_607705 [Xylaria bambusicola]
MAQILTVVLLVFAMSTVRCRKWVGNTFFPITMMFSLARVNPAWFPNYRLPHRESSAVSGKRQRVMMRLSLSI